MTTEPPVTPDELRRVIKRMGNICRYNGGVRRFYSVAEHTSIGLEVMARNQEPPHAMRAFAIHDMPESVLGVGDLLRDVKRDPAIAAIVGPREERAFARLRMILPYDDVLAGNRTHYYDRLMAVAEIETVADPEFQHDNPGDYDPHTHGFAARMILQPWAQSRTLAGWVRKLWPGVL